MSAKRLQLTPEVVRCMRIEDRRALGLAEMPPAGPEGSRRVRWEPEGGKAAEGGKARKRGPSVRRRPNKSEARYESGPLLGRGAVYEALTFCLANGHRYTPDWVVFLPDGRIECHEVKGAYRFGSHGRARLAFDQARAEFPRVAWVWATWNDGQWSVEGA